MIFDSDEQRKAVFASLKERGEFRDMYRRSRGFRSEIRSLTSQIRRLRYDRGTLKREIEMAEQRHYPSYVVKIKCAKLAELDTKIEKTESEKRRFQEY